jgi:branched-chain amino acid transport system substrate-binding protein
MRRAVYVLLLGCAFLFARADINVGVIVGATGPGASLGIPSKNTFTVVPTTIAGEKINYIILDDGTDTTNAVKNARRLITEDKVDVIIGPSSTPTATAVTYVAAETKTPQISLSPLAANNAWAFQVAQPHNVVVAPLIQHMKAHGAKSLAFIGFSDALGDTIYNALTPQAERAGIKVVANERYARTDTTVTGQVLKILATKPDAVVVGASGTPAALSQLTLIERGYKGTVYYTPAVVNKDFLRIGGKSLEGIIAAAGPAVVPEQLPDSSPQKKVGLEFTKLYEQAYGAGSRNQFSAHAYDAYLLFAHAVPVALKKAKPGTPEFRQALRDALEASKEVVGTTVIFNMTPTDHAGADSRSVVLVQVDKGEWKLMK